METDFFKDSLKAMLPITLIFCFLYVSGHFSSDYYFHLNYDGKGNYPPFLSWIMPEYNKGQFLFLLNLFLTVFLPFILIVRITKRMEAGWFYLYSGIPLVLFVVWLIPQSIIHCLMLISIAFPEGLLLFLLLGWAIHQYWWAAFILTIAYLGYRKYGDIRATLHGF